jgi:hypothetical protein
MAFMRRSITPKSTSIGHEIWKVKEQIHLSTEVKYGFQCTDFNGTQNYSMILSENLIYRTPQKSAEKRGK